MILEVPTYTVQLYIAGDIGAARRFIQREVYETGLCVTLEPLEHIYTGACEAGMRVGFINYPRFPAEPSDIFAKAHDLGRRLMVELGQHSFSIVGSDKTVFETRRTS